MVRTLLARAFVLRFAASAWPTSYVMAFAILANIEALLSISNRQAHKVGSHLFSDASEACYYLSSREVSLGE
jgi:hypothetical protein